MGLYNEGTFSVEMGFPLMLYLEGRKNAEIYGSDNRHPGVAALGLIGLVELLVLTGLLIRTSAAVTTAAITGVVALMPPVSPPGHHRAAGVVPAVRPGTTQPVSPASRAGGNTICNRLTAGFVDSDRAARHASCFAPVSSRRRSSMRVNAACRVFRVASESGD
jgi:hypothetical protein